MMSSGSHMSDALGIVASWSKDRQRNVFGIRGIGDQYDRLYKWLNGSKCSARSVSNDWPWDYIVFDDPFDEQSFMVLYKENIYFDEDLEYAYRPLPKNPKGWVPYEERTEGQSYLEVCGHYHVWKAPSGRDLADEITDTLGQAIADEIDHEIVKGLTSAHTQRASISKESIPELWKQLKTLKPFSVVTSFHVIEAHYLLDEKNYIAYWEIGDNCETPFEIELVITTRG